MDLNKLYSQELKNLNAVKFFGQHIYNIYHTTPQVGVDIFDTLLQKGYKKTHVALASQLWNQFRVTATSDESRALLNFRLESENEYGVKVRSPAEILNELKSWFYIETKGAFYSPAENHYYTMDQASNLAMGVFPDQSSATIKRMLLTVPSIAHVKRSLYRPTLPSVFVEDGVECCNSYGAPDITPKKGDVSLFVEHLQWMFPQDWKYLHDWIGYLIQCRQPRVQWACVLTGKPGIGKTMVGTVLTRLLGKRNIINPTPKTLEDKFNSWASQYQLAVVNEFKIAEYKKEEIYEGLKTLITDESVAVRKMQEDATNGDITTSFIFIGNERNFMPVDKDERRLCVMHSTREQKDKTRFEYSQVINLYKNHLEFLYHYFLNIDLTEFDPTLPPMTTSKRTLIDGNVKNILREFVELGTPSIFCIGELQEMVNSAFPDLDFMSVKAVKEYVGDIICSLPRTRVGESSKFLMCKIKDYASFSKLTGVELKDIYLKGKE